MTLLKVRGEDFAKLEICDNCEVPCSKRHFVSYIGDVCTQCRDDLDEIPDFSYREDFHSDG